MGISNWEATKRVRIIFLAAIMVCSVLFMIFTDMRKVQYHEDEIMTFLLSNNETGEKVLPPFGKQFDYAKAFDEGMTVAEGQQFQYKQVFMNQMNDVHPPLYYLIMHTICSLTPGRYSFWYGYVINIVCMLASIMLIYACTAFYFFDERIRFVVTAFFALCPAQMEIMCFVRMYALAILFFLYFWYWFNKQLFEEETKLKDYVLLLIVTVLGALTHYYFIVMAVLFSVSYALYQLKHRKKKKCITFCVTMVLSAILSIGIFPAMLFHVFGGYRGVEAFGNVVNLFDFPWRLIVYINRINRSVFGYLLLFLIIFVAHMFRKSRKNGEVLIAETLAVRLRYNFWPLLIYMLLVIKTSAYIEPRYISFAYGPLIILFFTYFVPALQKTGKSPRALYICAIVLTLISSVTCHYIYLQTEGRESIEVSAQYADLPQVLVLPQYETWMLNQQYRQLHDCPDVTLIPIERMSVLSKTDVAGSDRFIARISSYDPTQKGEVVPEQILHMCPNVSKYTKLYSWKLEDVFLFE